MRAGKKKVLISSFFRLRLQKAYLQRTLSTLFTDPLYRIWSLMGLVFMDSRSTWFAFWTSQQIPTPRSLSSLPLHSGRCCCYWIPLMPPLSVLWQDPSVLPKSHFSSFNNKHLSGFIIPRAFRMAPSSPTFFFFPFREAFALFYDFPSRDVCAESGRKLRQYLRGAEKK